MAKARKGPAKGKKKGEGMTVQVSLRLPKPLAATINETAEMFDEERTSLIVAALEEHFRAYAARRLAEKEAQLQAWRRTHLSENQ